MRLLKGMEPERVLFYFEEISSIPRGSGKTERISEYLKGFAIRQSLKYIQDKNNNIIIFKDGSQGCEKSDPVILQGHMDMVCEKNEGTDIDFDRDGLRLKLCGRVLSAEGTTLGGDDGIAVAYILAILEADDIKHPPIEAVITSDEEIGMVGASALDTSVLSSKRMINLDSEDEGIFIIGCAGGRSVKCHIPVSFKESLGTLIRLSVKGLKGGHSGEDINRGRGNANKLMGRLLYHIRDRIGLISIDGGSKDNAIPRRSDAEFIIKDADEAEKITDAITDIFEDIKNEYEFTDPGIELEIEKKESAKFMVLDKDSADRVLGFLYLCPNAIQKMSPAIEGLVRTSLNLGIVNSHEKEIVFSFLLRSSMDSEKMELCSRLDCLTELFCGYTDHSGDYPAWEFNSDSGLLSIMRETYEEKYKKSPKITVIHAGLECGIFNGRIEGLDCVSIGPDMKDIHTPDESLDLDSVLRTYEFLLSVLERM
ncbi:MAG: aminoacyl-histidine dipeptidase [Lachnospiraceae bacterium]|nr:aminoacyl-histidine dipeptidase [Lachnospiraceae bacterium]